jgi:hypothetical protein
MFPVGEGEKTPRNFTVSPTLCGQLLKKQCSHPIRCKTMSGASYLIYQLCSTWIILHGTAADSQKPSAFCKFLFRDGVLLCNLWCAIH